MPVILRPLLRSVALFLPLVSLVPACTPARPTPPAQPRHALVDVDYPLPGLTAAGTERGTSSWYGPGFHGELTASGERYDQLAMTAAHRTLPLGTWIEVTNLANHRRVRVRVNDRGPYKTGRILDLSYSAADALRMIGPGTALVEIRIADPRYRAWPNIRYGVQIGAYRDRTKADAAGIDAARYGESAYLKLTRNTEFPWSVRVGPFEQRRDALAARDRLHALGIRGLLVEEDPPPSVYAIETRSGYGDGAVQTTD